MKNYTQLSLEERRRFNAFLDMNYSISEISRRLGRHRSTLYRELKRNQTDNTYRATTAQQQALSRKQRPCFIQKNLTLRSYVIRRLKEGWSPEQIAGRLKRKKSKYTICHETIYRYIYKHNYKLHQYLPYKKPKRRKPIAPLKFRCRYGDSRLIINRPKYVEPRNVIGHWEGDSIEFKKNKKQLVITLVERKTRFVMLIKVETKSSEVVMSKIINKIKSLPPGMFKTITFDQGVEFANYVLLERETNCSVYYCHPRSPWEKGANENMNGRLRRPLPKNLDIRKITQTALDDVETSVNKIPRKCLAYKTAEEVFARQIYEANLYQNRVCR